MVSSTVFEQSKLYIIVAFLWVFKTSFAKSATKTSFQIILPFSSAIPIRSPSASYVKPISAFVSRTPFAKRLATIEEVGSAIPNGKDESTLQFLSMTLQPARLKSSGARAPAVAELASIRTLNFLLMGTRFKISAK